MERTRFRSPRTRITNTSHECPAYSSLTPETAWRKSQLSSVPVFLMATTSKKGADKTKVKARNRSLKKSQPKHPEATKELRRERDEALEQLAAASDILRMIARSPTDLQPVLDAIAESAAKLCDAADAVVWRVDGDVFRPVSHFGAVPTRVGRGQGVTRGTAVGRAILDRQTIHIEDLAEAAKTEFPGSEPFQKRTGTRTFLCTPMFREGVPIGLIAIRRTEVRPFTERQIKLLETFADQAVIAIENVRLFQELKEALEQQTATSEILGVIAGSPTDIQPVLEAVAQSAARLCDAKDAVVYRLDRDVLERVALFGQIPIRSTPLRLSRGTVSGRAVVDRQTIHIHDIDAESETEFPDVDKTGREGGSRARTRLAVPLLREGVALGAILIRRMEVRPFTDQQVALLQTFADQAVIAIENVRLFQELQVRNRDLTEALEQQTATSEILRVISSSPTDLQPVMDTIAESAARLCASGDAQIYRVETDFLRKVASYGTIPTARAVGDTRRIVRGSVTGRAIVDRQIIHIHDMMAEREENYPEARRIDERMGIRTSLAVPLLREGVAVGTILIRRTEVRPFSDKQIALLKTFADQAVIAIENVRLFQELTEALEQQTATSEILGVIASSPTDIQPVLDTVAENAARVCGATDAVIFRIDGNSLNRAAHYGPILWAGGEESSAISRGLVAGRAVVDRCTIHIHDMATESETEFPEGLSFQKRAGHRTILATPLLREGIPIGTIMIRRTEVRPFSDKQIKLLETFADQAVIAIENVRLFKELQERNSELREALEHQTATAEVLGIISRSPTDVQPVLDAIVESAARVCGVDDVLLRLREGNATVPRAHFGPIPLGRGEISIDEPHYRWVREHGTLNIPDVRAVQNDFPTLGVVGGFRTFLAAPLRQQDQLIGTLNARRNEVRPFTPAQIKLLETFADQAVIAIENVRLFKELEARNRDLTEALEQQTATSEILRVIASSPTDIQPVLDVVAENAARLCDASDALILRVAGDTLQTVARFGPIASAASKVISRDSPVGRAIVDRKTIHVPDLAAEIETEFPESKARQQLSGTRTMLVTPLLREGVPIGVITIRRTEVRPFSEKQIKLLETFADQAVIAIENVRLFQELEARTRELAQSVGELKALGRSRPGGQFYSRSPDCAQHHRAPCGTAVRRPMAALSTSTTKPRKSFISGPVTAWKRR